LAMKLGTIGYEGVDPDAFDNALLDAGIQTLVDVRAVAVSRRRGFSKTALSERLVAKGIRYLHLRNLGDPKPGRLAARAGEFGKFQRIYNEHLRSTEAVESLSALALIVGRERVALMCFEADATQCHRLIVARRLATSANLEIVHLNADTRGGRSEQSRASGHPGKGLAAA
jgi:uncharacterized protein (DUF488 family)